MVILCLLGFSLRFFLERVGSVLGRNVGICQLRVLDFSWYLLEIGFFFFRFWGGLRGRFLFGLYRQWSDGSRDRFFILGFIFVVDGLGGKDSVGEQDDVQEVWIGFDFQVELRVGIVKDRVCFCYSFSLVRYRKEIFFGVLRVFVEVVVGSFDFSFIFLLVFFYQEFVFFVF